LTPTFVSLKKQKIGKISLIYLYGILKD